MKERGRARVSELPEPVAVSPVVDRVQLVLEAGAVSQAPSESRKRAKVVELLLHYQQTILVFRFQLFNQRLAQLILRSIKRKTLAQFQWLVVQQ